MSRLLILTLVAFSVNAHAAFHGTDLAKLCGEDAAPVEATHCLWYFTGYDDAMFTVKLAREILPQRTGPLYCAPEEMTPPQMRDVVLKFMKANPSKADTDGATVVLLALHEAFPCSPSSPR